MASAPAENTPQLSHVNVFWKKNIFPLDVVRFLGGTEEGQPGGPRGQVLEFTGPWVSLNQTPLLLGSVKILCCQAMLPVLPFPAPLGLQR